jgi:hypothetical protein
VALVEHPVEHPVAPLGDREHVGEQDLGLVDLDPAVAHRRAERVVLLLGALHPDHVVEQEIAGVGRGEPRVLEARPVHEHLVELPDLGVDVEGRRPGLRCSGYGFRAHRYGGTSPGDVHLERCAR